MLFDYGMDDIIDGWHCFRPNDGLNVTYIRNVADDIRCNMRSEIIGIGVAEDADGRQQICDRYCKREKVFWA
jgi:hypothetical protein